MIIKKDEKKHLGSGIAFPLKIKEKDGRLVENSMEERVRQSILLILQTSKNERVMRPDFGCRLNDVVFMPINVTTITLVKNIVAEALTSFEPRISLEGISVQADTKNPWILNISIDYIINETNQPQNLVYPFFMEKGV